MAKQLRGEQLKEAIRECIMHLASTQENYTYNASELARLINTSRVTLNKHSEFIDSVLDETKAVKRVQRGAAMVEQLLAKIEKLEADKLQLTNELNALRCNHADIYRRLYANSIDVAHLIQPVIEDESNRAGECVLCSSKLGESTIKSSSNVLPISKKAK